MVYLPSSISCALMLLMPKMLQELLYMVTLIRTKWTEPPGIIDENYI